MVQAISVPITTAAQVGIGQKFKYVGKFLMTDGVSELGRAYYDAHKAGTANISTFAWKDTYVKIIDKSSKETAKKTAENAAKSKGLWAGTKALLGKIPGMKFVGKHFGPLLTIAFTGMDVVKGYKDGGVAEAGKAGIKSVLNLAGYAVGSLAIAALFGCTGFFPLLIAGMAGSMAADWLGKKVLGKSIAEQKEEMQAAQQQESQQQTIAQNTNFNPYGINRNVVGNPYNNMAFGNNYFNNLLQNQQEMTNLYNKTFTDITRNNFI